MTESMTQRYIPRFHLRPVSGWINDPNGPFQLNGRFHLFCQHNAAAAEHSQIHWAHFSSADLAHWTSHPTALAPTPGGPDSDGCWSGSAVLLDGEPWLVYSGNLAATEHQTVCLAAPRPGLEIWSAERDPIMAAPPEAAELAAFRDPFVWREGDTFRMIVGAGYRNRTGAALLYRSDDLRSWTPMGPLCTAAHPAFDAYDTGDVWECPQLLRRGNRGVLVVSIWRSDTGTDHAAYISGRLDGEQLVPEVVGRLDHGPDLYAPALMMDDSGRCLLWGWSWEARSGADAAADGWAGVLTVPRLVQLARDGTPRMLPVPELAALRGAVGGSVDLDLLPRSPQVLDAAAGNALDLEVRLTPDTGGRAWVRVLADPYGSERTEIGVDGVSGEVYLCRDRSSVLPGAHPGTYRMPVGLDAGGGVDLRILVDASILEVFAGDGMALTARVYPSPPSVALVAGADRAPGRAAVRWWPMEGGLLSAARES